jgi:hypothetical protein
MRKVSLRRLEAEIASLASKQKSLPAEVLFLAGLQRVEYVFVYPESRDVVIAGPAEGWTRRGTEMVGVSTGHAVLRLDDLLDALHGNAAGADGQYGISCSIDPTDEGMARVQQMFRSGNLRVSERLLQTVQRELGDQNVTITGVRPASHFARVIVSADYLMKRIAMGLDPSPLPNLPSYLQLLQRGPASTQMMAPRWWLATDYPTAQRSEDGLAWRFAGRGVQAMTEHGYLNARGQLVNTGRPSPLAKRWADQFTAAYDQLPTQIPAFGQLQGCFDLALMAALLTQESLLDRADCELDLLTDSSKLVGESYSIPKLVPSQASAVRGRSGWIVSVSGGVDLDTWNVLKRVQTSVGLSAVRTTACDENVSAWWWD